MLLLFAKRRAHQNAKTKEFVIGFNSRKNLGYTVFFLRSKWRINAINKVKAHVNGITQIYSTDFHNISDLFDGRPQAKVNV